ncbi:unnamed protein product [Cylicocyclus nassatus]|uniref:Uncharacterized protein n=1 Tax=Cylicocyclus nassatus TaxID=53992 RepID=A0AA36HG97_CYLNA|nr:unnamed protein product [Cylicocyclus nassatus]
MKSNETTFFIGGVGVITGYVFLELITTSAQKNCAGLDGELTDYNDYDSSDIHGIDNFTIDDEDVNSHLQIQATLQHFQECRDKKWSCDRDCSFITAEEVSTLGQQPFPHDKCFGIPINYKYTRDHNIGRFPIELGVLSRYPRCWSYLGPLICATIFRPCSRHYFIEKEENGSVKDGTIELWQLLDDSVCEKAVQMCGDVISSGLFPSFIRCKDVSTNDTGMKSRLIYSNKCQHSIDDYPVKVDEGACPWPLVLESSSLQTDSTPLLDNCYLPCRSPFVSPPLSDRFRTVRFFICTLLTILFFSESIFLSRFCKLFTEHNSLFYISHAVICAATYCLVWSLSYFDIFFTLSECAFGGVSRRFALSHSIFEWCSIHSIILYTSFLAAYIWLLLLYVNAICPPSMISFYFTPRSFRICSRLFLIFCVYGISVIISFFVMSSLRENDGVSGVCHYGLLTWWKYLASMFPLVCIALILISFILIVSHKRKEIMNRLALRHALDELNGDENQEYTEHFPRFETDGDAVFAHVPGAVNGPLSIDVRCVRENQGLLRENPNQQMFWNVYNRSQRLLSERLCRERNSGISIRWIGASFILFMLFLVVSPFIHYHYVAMPARHEEESIVEYITCHVAHTIRNRSVEWITQNDYPLPNSHDALWCSLPLRDARDRLEGILVVFVILPVLPFLVLLMAFLAGLNGYGRFGKWQKHDGGSEFSKVPVDCETCEAIPMKPVVVHKSDVEAASPSSKDTKASFMEAVDETQIKLQTESHDVETGDSTSVAEGDRESQKEYQEELMNIINKIRDELAFQQSMLVTDGAAWNISLYYMRRIEQLLSKLQSSDIKADRIYKELQTFGNEMSRVVPSVSSHVMQLSRWMDSVRETYLNIEHLRSDPEEHQYPVGSGDISRQQELIALNDYIMRMAASTSSHHESPQACTTNAEFSTVEQENVNSGPLPVEKVKEQPSEQICAVSREQRQDSVEDQQPGPSHDRQDAPEMVPPADRRTGVPINGNAAVPSQSSVRARQILRISAYAESYSATPQGILTRLTVPELRIRVQQIKNICAGDSLYPQELSYMLLVTGDITFGGNTAREDFHLYTMEQLPSIFGANVPSIDARIGVQDFLVQMRRRALCVVAAIGYHFSLHHRRGLEYTPPVLPPLGLYRSENELILRRVLGDNDDVLPSLRDFLQEFQFGRGPVVPRLDLRFATAFRNYLCLVAAREGFDNNIEEYVPDPDPPQEPSNAQADADDSDEDNDPDF